MKKLLGIMVLGLLLIIPSYAADISEFEIEGMSIGDNLLDYMSEEEIKDIVKNLKNENYRFYYKTTDDGKSYADVSDFFFKDGSTIRAWCTNWSKTTEKKRNWKDNMSLALNSKEFDYWVKNKDKMIIALSLKEFDKWLKNEAHK